MVRLAYLFWAAGVRAWLVLSAVDMVSERLKNSVLANVFDNLRPILNTLCQSMMLTVCQSRMAVINGSSSSVVDWWAIHFESH